MTFALQQSLTPEAKYVEQVLACRRCDLANQTTVTPTPWKIVPGSRVLVLAEAPGAHENAKGTPLVGPAGRCLDKMLSDSGIDPDSVSRGNVANCYPCRAPTVEEVSACKPNFDTAMDIIRPRFILVLGSVALRALYPGLSVSAAHGLWWHESDLPGSPWCLSTFHPSYVLREFSQRKVVMDDLIVFQNQRDDLYAGSALCAICRKPGQPRPPKNLPLCPDHLDPIALIMTYFPGSTLEP